VSEAEKTEPAPQATRIVEQQSAALARSAADAAAKLGSAGSVISAACALLNQRARYVGVTGEHFSVHEYDGIQCLDALDERLLKELRTVLSVWASRARRKPDPAALDLLDGKLKPGAKEMPPYPVGYMVHYMLTNAVRSFEAVASEGHGFDLAALETALVHHLLGMLDRYAETREKPVTRHFSDVAREHNVVLRLKCGCGQEKYQVRLQALYHAPDGSPFDRLDLQCAHCGSLRVITFDLPNFRDMVRM
jgi:hypothetical protein